MFPALGNRALDAGALGALSWIGSKTFVNEPERTMGVTVDREKGLEALLPGFLARLLAKRDRRG